MIAKSDLLILTVSTLALAVGVYRWQSAQSIDPATAAAPAATRVDPRPSAPAPASGVTTATALPADATQSGGSNVVVRRLAPRGTDAAETPATAAAADTAAFAGGAARRGASGTTSLVTAEPGAALFGVYRVRSGDYLSGIAERLGTTVATLSEINDLDGTLIFPDQELRYPLPAN